MIAATSRALVVAPTKVLARSFTHQTWVSGPPRTRISLAEKAVHGLVIAVGVLATPMYIVSHIKDYRKD